jgi:hypothetical protein
MRKKKLKISNRAHIFFFTFQHVFYLQVWNRDQPGDTNKATAGKKKNCFNHSLPLMMLKNKQTNCLFVNFKKEIKTKGIGNICFWIIKIKTDISIYWQTDWMAI